MAKRFMSAIAPSLHFTNFKSNINLQIATQFRFASTSAPKEYDWLIVGAGSAGCVLANKLSANSNSRVCVLEAGPRDLSIYIHIPAGFSELIFDRKHNWCYDTIPQPQLGGRKVFWPRGKVWGGSSSINAMVFNRCQREDYDEWARNGCPGWSFKDCLPTFKAMENYKSGLEEKLTSSTSLMLEANSHAQAFEKSNRGHSGPLRVSNARLVNHAASKNILQVAFIESAHAAGIHYNPDFNGERQEGVGWFDLTLADGTRQSAARAFLYPALSRKNLTVRSDCLVTRVLLDEQKKRAVGVELQEGKGAPQKIYAKEVILSGGSVNTPQILMLSGIGDEQHLRSMGIDVALNLPAVGKNLQDHIRIDLQWSIKRPELSVADLEWKKAPVSMLKAGIQWNLSKSGIAASNHCEAGGFFKAFPTDTNPTIQLHFEPLIFSMTSAGDLGRKPGFNLPVTNLRGKGRGSILLASPDPTAPPRIDPAYLSNKDDVKELLAGVKIAREIPKHGPLKEHVLEEVRPGKKGQSDGDLLEFIKKKLTTMFHPAGTCRMGVPGAGVPDNQLVVDSRSFKVLGLDGLRVVDASVMPIIASGNLNCPVMMIANRAAEAFSKS